MGVWIEIGAVKAIKKLSKSLPVWECGLKYVKHVTINQD